MASASQIAYSANIAGEEKEKEGEECPQSSLAQCTCDLELELSGDLRLS